MTQAENFLHTTHRTVTWFNKAFQSEELELAAPFQRNAVWTNMQKSYLIDTILNFLPIPELYMQDSVTEEGEETHIVVDGQQRIRAVLDFVNGKFSLQGDDVERKWRGRRFEDLDGSEKKSIFNYKFVVRILPANLQDPDIRAIFARINKNTVTLTDQELRNATYWGPFIKSIQEMADNDPFWANSGLFSANEHRRMLDHEYISELAIAFLHGPQNKKDRLDYYYRLYEEDFENKNLLVEAFKRVCLEMARIWPAIAGSRWRKKSDFYTFFLEMCRRVESMPFDASVIAHINARLSQLGSMVDSVLRLEEEEWKSYDADVIVYARNVARAASDKANRIARAEAFSRFVFDGAEIVG